MLLSIDRLLQLVSEGKSLEKIAELADCEVSDVTSLINEARELLSRHEKALSKRKIIIKKKKENKSSTQNYDDSYIREILNGAELSAIPVNTPIVLYIAGESESDPAHAGIGIVIFDQQNRQIGKVSDYVGMRTKLAAEYVALIRAIKLALYFQASEVKIRTDSELIIRQYSGKTKDINIDFRKFIDEINSLKTKIPNFKLEQITRSQNDKAEFLARKGSEKSK
ncbi:MAG TPA: reverse transcriptase-like protein [Spirochaetota bacterium]|nr:reverse transcriptase-like protein [Spirochaetota bacterium]HPJ40781.1 reverse transcriptase-like protein [Spirochaetota bacterium]HPR36050.1 reverse transcriptase-like protein [Spirochaetota bacterium]